MVDGTYGRLGAHNQRVKMLRSKKEVKYKKPDFMGMYKDGEGIADTEVQPEIMESIKEGIRQKSELEKRKQRLAIGVAVIGALLFGYWLLTSVGVL